MSSKVLNKRRTENLPVGGEKIEVHSNGKSDFEEIQSSQAQLEELRKIIIQPEEVGEVLPTALRKRARKNNQLAEATLPLVEENIRQSVQRDPKILAEAIFPIIGPAIRKAIAEALGAMVQSLNQTLEQSVSPKGLRWRIEAWKTGKPFGEVVMLNTLLYRVEQVFLIHKETGILLQHVSANLAETKDADMVSAMLTAIQDFVQDSFQGSENATLDALKVRELSVWIEHSPDAVLAVVIRGNAPLNLRQVLIESIEKVQFEYENELDEFQGETKTFEPSRPILQDCLRLQVGESEQPKARIVTPFNALAAILGVLILVGGFLYIRDYRRWSNYVERLKSENGIVVIESNRGFFKHGIEGLRDESAINPGAILGEYGYDADDVVSHWKNYQDLSEPLILERAKRLLKPPPTANLTLENGILTVHGYAPNEWLLEARQTSRAISGINQFKVER
jgi:hypothetical protein